MFPKALLVTLMIAYVEARFGQEQVPIAAISAVQGGAAGAAATIAGATISDLLGAANACAKLSRADQIVTELGGGADAIAAAIGLVAAEKNTNPFANGNAQNVCADASLPATAELRGITPLIDPDVDVNGGVAALSQQTQGTPLDATGKSVFDLLSEAGFGDLVVAQNAAGGAAAAGGAQAGNNTNANQGGAAQNAAGNNNNAASGTAQNGQNQQQGKGKNNMGNAGAGNANQNACNNANNNQQGNNANQQQGKNNAGNAGAGNANQNAGNNQQNNNANQQQGKNNAGNAGAGAAAGGAADFGDCPNPTITFQGGEGNRPATEFTFQIADATARGGQGEALNPNIITNALCNNLTNNCNANAAAKALCEDAKAQVEAAGTRDKSTADLFNTAIGFPGAVTNPAGGPENPPAAAGAARKMRRGMRSA